MKSMDPEHASIAGRAFFSQAEKNQKAQRRGEKLYGEGAALRLVRQNSLRAQTLPLQDAAALQPPRLLFSERLPSGRKRQQGDSEEVGWDAPLTDRDLATARSRSIEGDRIDSENI